MSSNPVPPPRDRTPLYIAIVGATATIAAALIGVLPTVVNNAKNANQLTPTVVVITATSFPTLLAQATTPPTGAPTPTQAPSPTQLPTAIPQSPTAVEPTLVFSATVNTPAPIAPPVVGNVLLLINNLPRRMDFLVDGRQVTTIDSGDYQRLPITRGPHDFRQWVSGADQSLPENCHTETTNIGVRPEYWELYDEANPVRATNKSVLLVLNQAQAPQDIYINNTLAGTVQPRDFAALDVAPGALSLLLCGPGNSPTNGACAGPYSINVVKKTDTFRIVDGSS